MHRTYRSNLVPIYYWVLITTHTLQICQNVNSRVMKLTDDRMFIHVKKLFEYVGLFLSYLLLFLTALNFSHI